MEMLLNAYWKYIFSSPSIAFVKTTKSLTLGVTPFLRFEKLGKFWFRNEKLRFRNDLRFIPSRH